MSSSIFTSLADQVNTVADLRTLETELATIRAGVYGTGRKKLQTVMKDQVRASVASVLMPALEKNPEQLLNELSTELQHLPLLRLRIAFEPTQATVQKVTDWLRANSDTHWILDLVVDPAIVAGTIIEVNGLYRDYSSKNAMAAAVQQATRQLLKT